MTEKYICLKLWQNMAIFFQTDPPLVTMIYSNDKQKYLRHYSVNPCPLKIATGNFSSYGLQ